MSKSRWFTQYTGPDLNSAVTAVEMKRLTGTGGFLAALCLPALALTVLAPQLGGGRVAEADAGDGAGPAGHRAGGPRRPVAPTAVLLD